jgi:hypothetical protein
MFQLHVVVDDDVALPMRVGHTDYTERGGG